jgi:sortase A
VAFLALSSPVFVSRWRYDLAAAKAEPTSMPTPAVQAAAPSPTPLAVAANVPITDLSRLIIPKLGVSAPIIYEPTAIEANIQVALRSGVIHYATTAMPGQNGNVVIFGHSSNDWWQPGEYKFVFVLLDKLVPGDFVTLDYQSKRYTYQVTGSRVVEPTAFSVLDATPTPTLSLITCTPAGTSLRRLVVSAKLAGVQQSSGATVAETPEDSSSGEVVRPQGDDSQLVGSPGVMTTIWNGLRSLFQ